MGLIKLDHERANLRARYQCLFCRLSEALHLKRADEPNGSHSQPRNDGIVNWVKIYAWFCCWRGRHCSQPLGLCPLLHIHVPFWSLLKRLLPTQEPHLASRGAVSPCLDLSHHGGIKRCQAHDYSLRKPIWQSAEAL